MKKIAGFSILAGLVIAMFVTIGIDIGLLKTLALIGTLSILMGLIILAVYLITGEA
jgi:hypothetical protein